MCDLPQNPPDSRKRTREKKEEPVQSPIKKQKQEAQIEDEVNTY